MMLTSRLDRPLSLKTAIRESRPSITKKRNVMDAKIMGLGDLFDFDVSYRIPEFQRPYAWSEEQWEGLWNDVQKVAEKILRAPDSPDLLPHFMGAIVVQPLGDDTQYSEVRPVLVVDGQQRLTTLQLLIKAISMEFTSALVSTTEFGSLRNYMFNNENRTGGDYLKATKIRQSNGLDQADFQDIIRDRLGHNRPPRSIVDAYGHFRNWVSTWLNREPEHVAFRARALYEVLIKYLKVATIDLDSGEKPHFIFEILNSRGERLKEADYIKNTVMYEADVIDDGERARGLWGMFEDDWWRKEESRGRDLQMQLDRFLNYWCTMRLGEYVPIRRTASTFRGFVEQEKELHDTPIDAVANEIKKAGVVYKNIEENRQPGIEDVLKRVKTLEIGVIMPPLLWLYTQNIGDQEREAAVRGLESYLVRRALCKLGSQGLNRLFIELVKHLESDASVPADQAVIRFLGGQTAENRLWPNDRRVTDFLAVNPMPGNAARRKMILEAIEINKRPPMAEGLGETANLTVEHLLPQRWHEEGWPLPDQGIDKRESTDTRNGYVALIGNLTLATKELNSSMSNRSWENKRKALNKFSALFINKELLEGAPPVWDEHAIEHRSQQLGETITKIWQRPAI